MKFYDESDIIIQSGKGGDGLIAGRREKGVPRGGPAGGDGGAGGSVFFVADENEYTLLPLRYRKIWKAQNGQAGQGKDRYGADGEDKFIPVPLGTLIKDKHTGQVLAHLTQHQQQVRLAAGGRGGKGNIHFKTPTNQYPNIALYGEPGQKKELRVELQLLGDIALIGTPSVGKSTLINSISNVKARTAAYEFTTLVPNLGIIDYKGKSFAMVDVPGLIKGAGEGKGLGNMFLRHILKARAWVIMLDATKDLPGIQEWSLLLEEIKQYIDETYVHRIEQKEIEKISHILSYNNKLLHYQAVAHTQTGEEQVLLQKAILTVVNKYDVLDEELWSEYREHLLENMHAYLKGIGVQISSGDLRQTTMTLSALTKVHTDVFLDTCLHIVTDASMSSIAHYEIGEVVDIPKEVSIIESTADELPFLLAEGYIQKEQVKKMKIRTIIHPQIAYFTFVLPRGNDEAEMRYWQTLARDGYLQRYQTHGAKKGDILKIVSPYIGTADRYVLWD